MGDYSAICAVTGVPICGRQSIVGFNLERYKYAESEGKSHYIPMSWPVFGKYNYGGGIEGEDLTPCCALIHKEVWDNAPAYWHYMNRRNGPDFLDIPTILDKAKKEASSSYAMRFHRTWSETDYVYYYLRQQLDKTDEGLVSRVFVEGKDISRHTKKFCFLERGAFMEIVCKKILEGTYGDVEKDIFYRLACLWSGQMLTGKFIMPSIDPYIEQYPMREGYEKRIELLNFSCQVARNLIEEDRKERQAYLEK